MGLTRTDGYTESQTRLAELAKAIGHPARVAILEHLFSCECICGQLVDALPLSQATVSQHLKAMKEAGLIDGKVDGTSVCYCINHETWDEIREIFGNLFVASEDCKCRQDNHSADPATLPIPDPEKVA